MRKSDLYHVKSRLQQALKGAEHLEKAHEAISAAESNKENSEPSLASKWEDEKASLNKASEALANASKLLVERKSQW